jgi:hypothetical protein
MRTTTPNRGTTTEGLQECNLPRLLSAAVSIPRAKQECLHRPWLSAARSVAMGNDEPDPLSPLGFKGNRRAWVEVGSIP